MSGQDERPIKEEKDTLGIHTCAICGCKTTVICSTINIITEEETEGACPACHMKRV